MPETHVGEAAFASIMAAAFVESDLGRSVAENMSVSLQEFPVNPEPEQPVTHEHAVPISSTHLEIPEVDVPVTIETEPEPRSTNFTSEDTVSTFEVEEQHVLSDNLEAANVELNDDSILLAAAEPGREVGEAVVEPVSGTFESQTQHSVEETAEVSFIYNSWARSLVDCNKIIKEDHIAEAVASEVEFIVPNEGGSWSAIEVDSANSQLESSVEPIKEQLEIPELRERDRTVEIEPQIIPAIMEESPTQIEEDKAVPEALKVSQLLSSLSYLLIVVQ